MVTHFKYKIATCNIFWKRSSVFLEVKIKTITEIYSLDVFSHIPSPPVLPHGSNMKLRVQNS